MKALCFTLFCAFAFACTPKTDSSSLTVLTVGPHSVNVADFSKELARRLARLDLLSAKNPSVIQVQQNRILSDFILELLIQSDPDFKSLSIPESEVLFLLESIKMSYQNPLAFKEELVQNNYTEASFKSALEREIRVQRFFKHLQSQIEKPSEAECLDYYNRNKEEYMLPPRILVRQIVVKEQHQAEELLNLLKQNKKSFEELAKKYSIAPEALKEGLVGWVEEGQIQIFEPAFKLKPKQLSSVLESPFGFHILKLEEKQSKRTFTYQEVKDKISQILIHEQEQGLFLKWLDEQLRKTKVMKNSSVLQSLIIETKGSTL